MRLLSLFLLVAATSSQAAVFVNPWVPIFKGIDHATGEADASEVRLQKVNVLRIDLTVTNISFFSTPSNGTAPRETDGQTATTFLQTSGVQVAINANFFDPVGTTPNEPRDLSGLAISRGQVVSPACQRGIDDDHAN